jgi:spore maturation protein CgeB
VRVLVVHPGPAFSVADVHAGLVKGLRANGVQVFDFNFGDRLNLYSMIELEVEGERRKAFDHEGAIRLAAESLLGELYKFWPDVIVIVSTFFMPPIILEVLEKRPHHTVAWFTESPYEDRQQLQVAEHVDTVVVNDPLNLGVYRQVNPRSYYFPHSYDPDLHCPGPKVPEFECDFAFVGTGFPSRVEFFEACDFDGIEVRLAGNWQIVEDSPITKYLIDDLGVCCPNDRTVDIYRSCKASANVYRQEINEGGRNDGVAAGPREIELAATGTFFLRSPRPESDRLFPMLPTFTDPGDFIDRLRWWLAHDSEREAAAASARDVVADRTFDKSTARLLRLVDGAPKTVR